MSTFKISDLEDLETNSYDDEAVLLENFLAEIENKLSEIDLSKNKKIVKKIVKSKDGNLQVNMLKKYITGIVESENISDTDKLSIENLGYVLSLNDKYVNDIFNESKCYYVTNKLKDLLKDRILTDEITKSIEDLENSLKMSHDDVLTCYNNVAGQIVQDYFEKMIEDKRISPKEDAEFQSLCSNLHISIEMTEKQRSLLEDLRVLWKIENNKLEPIDSDINLLSNENLYFQSDVKWFETRKQTLGYSHMGVSKRIKIANGFSLNLGGGSSDRITEDRLTEIDSGVIYITNKRLIFVGRNSTKNIKLSAILSFEITNDGVKIVKDAGKSPVLRFENNDLAFAGILAFVMGWSDEFLKEYKSVPTQKNNVSVENNLKKDKSYIQHKSKGVALFLCLLFGLFGAHSFYVGRNKRGVFQLLLLVTGITVIWSVIDFISILLGTFKDANGNYLD